ncbi:MAG: tRNA dihydrouridine(20/20a) synthase DusA [Gammaproteobacteria bacterium]|nr:tRNA dihydrouridine(20/20a) synthase DusA [Gammaproteobacteria bacterium]
MSAAAGWRVCVAPMMDVTDRHCRYFLRQIAPRVRLYSEMITADAIIHGDRARLLDFDAAEHPLALQLGGHDPRSLVSAARVAAAWGYDEINLNVGCPSDRVREGRFGACLMLDAGRVAHCVEAMAEAVSVPVSIKTRIGVDDHDSYEFLAGFVERVAGAGCNTFIVHARKAILKGLSARENREIPPLQPGRVHRLKREFPQLTIVTNGGIRDLETIRHELAAVDGVMIGRKAAEDPCFLAAVEAGFLTGTDAEGGVDREQVVERMADYAARQARHGVPLHRVARHMLGLYHGQRGARAWRRFLAEGARGTQASPRLLTASLGVLHAAGRDGIID